MGWKFACASVAGSSHAAASTGCQDAYHCEVFLGKGGGTLLIVVADGAGSASRGAAGAAIVTSCIREQASAWICSGGTVRTLDEATLIEWLSGARENIANEAAMADLTMRDYAATMLIAMLDDSHSAFAQIGDGAIVTSDKPGEWDHEFWPQHGTFANQTYFVTDDGARENLKFAHGLHPLQELAVFSDGLELVLLNYAERRAHAPAFDNMLRPLRQADATGHITSLSDALARYLTSPAVTSRTDDDVTLVIASRR